MRIILDIIGRPTFVRLWNVKVIIASWAVRKHVVLAVVIFKPGIVTAGQAQVTVTG